MIIFDGNGEAISFNDDSSPRTDQTGGTKVCINAQVDRGLSLEWFYKLLALDFVCGDMRCPIGMYFRNWDLTVLKRR